MVKLNTFLINPNSSRNEEKSQRLDPGPLSSIKSLYRHAYDFLAFLIKDPTMDHLEVRFGREVIFGASELASDRMIQEPKKMTVEELLPATARPRGLSDSMIIRVASENPETYTINRFEKL